jgi:glutamate formiminotransferase/formiminotetrahydrofolate cyclodeaminase
MAIIECVPNFSEGRRQEIVDRIVAAIAAVAGVSVLGAERDPDHNRSVITLAGEPEAVLEAAFEGCREAGNLIDLRAHKGAHPRMGATDVIPFVPIRDITLSECAALAERLARRIGDELNIPTFLYGEAARRDDRRNLPDVRKGEFEGLREEIGRNPDRKPDFGPEKIHESAGATAVGARFFLIAYNVNLETRDLKLAKRIAKSIREKDGGMPAVKAMGFDLPAESCVQVSMNLVDYRKTSPAQAYIRIQELAAAEGVTIKNSEVVGLLPAEALELCARQMADASNKPAGAGSSSDLFAFAMQALKLKDFAPEEQVIELKMETTMTNEKFPYMTGINDFLRDLASDKPTPGGGAAAAVLGATGIALGEMVGNLTVGKKKYADVQATVKEALGKLSPMRDRMLALFAEDALAFEAFGDAGKLPKDTDKQKAARAQAMQKALVGATLTPNKTAQLGVEAFRELHEIAKVGNKHAISDCGVGALSLYACINAAVQNMRINLPGIKDTDFKRTYSARADEYETEAQRLLDATLKVVRAAIGE